MKIYVVTQGEYSDYRIITATTDKNVAKQIAKKFNVKQYDETHIEEYENAKIMLKPLYFIRMDKNGNVMECNLTTTSWCYDAEYAKVEQDRNKNTSTYVVASTPNAAIKIAAERRAKFLAEEMGL